MVTWPLTNSCIVITFSECSKYVPVPWLWVSLHWFMNLLFSVSFFQWCWHFSHHQHTGHGLIIHFNYKCYVFHQLTRQLIPETRWGIPKGALSRDGHEMSLARQDKTETLASRDRDVDNFRRDETETRHVSRPSRDRDVETETTTLTGGLCDAAVLHVKDEHWRYQASDTWSRTSSWTKWLLIWP